MHALCPPLSIRFVSFESYHLSVLYQHISDKRVFFRLHLTNSKLINSYDHTNDGVFANKTRNLRLKWPSDWLGRNEQFITDSSKYRTLIFISVSVSSPASGVASSVVVVSVSGSVSCWDPVDDVVPRRLVVLERV